MPDSLSPDVKIPSTQHTVVIDGVTLHLTHPDELPIRWVGQQELITQLLAAWTLVDPLDLLARVLLQRLGGIHVAEGDRELHD